jgi:D-mannonate dehydratase
MAGRSYAPSRLLVRRYVNINQSNRERKNLSSRSSALGLKTAAHFSNEQTDLWYDSRSAAMTATTTKAEHHMATKRKAPHARGTAAIARKAALDQLREALQNWHKLSDAELAQELDDAMEEVKRFCEAHGTTEEIERLQSLINEYRKALSARKH